MAESQTPLIPAFINPTSGSYATIAPLLKQRPELKVMELKPQDFTKALEAEVKAGTPRVLVSGGDGTLSLAANTLARTETALGVVAGGTLNHFSHNLGLPEDLEAAIELAITSPVTTLVDVGYVNDTLFLNTSSVGNYVRFVRTRDHLERHMSYKVASALAGVRRLVKLRSSRLWIDGVKTRSPLAFIGVKERELSLPALGQNAEGGEHGLHLIVIKAETRWQLTRMVFNAMFRGFDPLAKADQVENRIVEEVVINNSARKRGIYVACDGEIGLQQVPLHYRYERDVLKVVVAPASEQPPTTVD